MQNKDIVIRGAREHNLKNVNLSIPRNSLTVMCGLSGSGKSSLAFDTLYAEGQRRYVESLNAYARQFLGLMEKPDVDSIEGLSPAIAIEQKSTGHNPRSTVGTITEIHDYLRLLFARAGSPYCHKCGKPISRQTVQEIADTVLGFGPGTKYQILSPVVSGRKGEYHELLEKLRKDGFARVRIDGVVHSLDETVPLDKNKKHSVDVVVDRLVAGTAVRQRLTESLETALKLSSNGTVRIDCIGGKELVFSEVLACTACGVNMGELSPRMFSFNSPFGACEKCNGLGYLMELDEARMVPDSSLTLNEGAVAAWNAAGSLGSWNRQILLAVCGHFKIPTDKPWAELSETHRGIILYGTGKEKIVMEWRPKHGEGFGRFNRPFEGVANNLLRRYKDTTSEDIRRWVEEFMAQKPCPSCKGARLKPETLSVLIGGKNIAQISSTSIIQAKQFISELSFTPRQKEIARQILKEITQRLDFLVNVGLPYLSLDRVSSSLSGGESQRIRLATQIGSRLTGVLYILDEPSIGLHPADNSRLLKTLTALRDIGNTVVVIEHDRETLEAADYLVDVGPGAGVLGGSIVAAGTPAEVAKNPKSLTGLYLSGKKTIPIPAVRRSGSGKFLSLSKASGNNLKNVDVSFPMGTLTCITGVSGSGKSTLINHTLYPALARAVNHAAVDGLPFGSIKGMKHIDKVIDIDQSPIGRTPRSNPLTYTKTFDSVRDLFAMLPESKIRGYDKGRFSFNVKGGRCESCEGDGVLKIEMHFLPDVYVVCEACNGKRYNRETLEITFKGKNIADVLNMTVDEGLKFFENIPAIKSRLAVLSRVGLGYIHLGQQATTLSGGEAQRIKLSAELARRATGSTLYILDEPTTGLHFEDILMLMDVLQELVDKGNSVIIIEHNLDVIKCADYIIDLGPEGGDKGGLIVATGTPEQIAANPASLTGKYLKHYLKAPSNRINS
jgi:excinuclease ABC subunit A